MMKFNFKRNLYIVIISSLCALFPSCSQQHIKSKSTKDIKFSGKILIDQTLEPLIETTVDIYTNEAIILYARMEKNIYNNYK